MNPAPRKAPLSKPLSRSETLSSPTTTKKRQAQFLQDMESANKKQRTRKMPRITEESSEEESMSIGTEDSWSSLAEEAVITNLILTTSNNTPDTEIISDSNEVVSISNSDSDSDESDGGQEWWEETLETLVDSATFEKYEHLRESIGYNAVRAKIECAFITALTK